VTAVNVLEFERGKVFEFVLVSEDIKVLISVSHLEKKLVVVCFGSKCDVNFVDILLMILKRRVTCPHLIINIRILIHTMVLKNSRLVAHAFDRLNLAG